MKIIIIGAGGFIGSHLTKRLTEKHQVLPVYKDTFDVLDQKTVETILSFVKPDYVINCLSFGGNENVSSNSTEYFTKNLALFWNFYTNRNHFGKYINIGSGIEKKNDQGAYAASKRIISDMLGEFESQFLNFYLYGCFGKDEKPNRLLKKYLASLDTDEPFKIQNDRYFDYISVQDFYKFIEFELDGKLREKTSQTKFDCVYRDKLLISEFLDMFCDINNIRKNFVIESTSDTPYIGMADHYRELRYYGLAHGLREYML